MGALKALSSAATGRSQEPAGLDLHALGLNDLAIHFLHGQVGPTTATHRTTSAT